MRPQPFRFPQWLATGFIGGLATLGAEYALTVSAGLNRPTGCATGNSYFPGGELLILLLAGAGAAAGWWTTRRGGSWRQGALAGLTVGMIAGILPLVMVSTAVPTPPPGCPTVPPFVRDNWDSIVWQTRLSALVEMAVVALLGAIGAARWNQRRRIASS